jgi:methyltransferase family protein
MPVDVDWADHWREMQVVRAEQAGGQRRDFWDRRAPGFALAPAPDQQGQQGNFLDFIEPWIHPTRTLIDVGAGVGRLSVPLTNRLRWVTAVEPSQGMRDHIPCKPNLTVIPSPWHSAEVAAADLVICVHVLYSVRDPVRFIEKLDAAATEHVFIVMRDSPHTHPAERLRDSEKAQPPQLRECFMLLRQIGIAPDIAMFTHSTSYYFANLEAAVAECRLSVGPTFDEPAGRAWLAENLQPQPDGVLAYDGGTMTSGILHWSPQRSSRSPGASGHF